jgi:phosphoserine aminotransferase
MPVKPNDDRFGSGPTRKIPGWSKLDIDDASLGRSHRGATGLAMIDELLARLRAILEIPNTHKIALVNGGATGATEFLLWNLLGKRPVDVFSAGIFGDHWYHDVANELKIRPVRSFIAPVGLNPDFSRYDPSHDCVFVLHETPSGTVFFPELPLASEIMICDATSAVFCMDVPWIDAVSFAFQKGIGGEGGLGAVVLGPKAIEGLLSYTPPRPLPRLYRGAICTENGKRIINENFFAGHTVNTISLLTVSDMLLNLKWAEEIGGLPELKRRVMCLYDILADWVDRTPWVDFLVQDPSIRAKNSVCLTICNADWEFLRKMLAFLEKNGLESGILNYVHSHPSLRIWLGPAVDPSDLRQLLPWVEAAFDACREGK